MNSAIPPSIRPVNPQACFGFPQHQGKDYCKKLFAPPMQIVGPRQDSSGIVVYQGEIYGFTTGSNPRSSWYYVVNGGVIGDAYTFAIVDGALNSGLVLLSNGVVSGIVQGDASPSHATIRATNCAGCSVDLDVIVNVVPTPQ